MNRRSLLSSIGTAGVVSLAGCVSGDAGSGGPSDENATATDENPTHNGTPSDDTETPTDSTDTASSGGGTESPSPAEGPTQFADATLKIIDTGPGQQVDSAHVCFDYGATQVLITGTIWGSNTCKIPALADATYDTDADELTVTVTTKNRDTEGTPVCGQSITELDYRVTASFDGGLPGSVTVRHDHGKQGRDVVTESES